MYEVMGAPQTDAEELQVDLRRKPDGLLDKCVIHGTGGRSHAMEVSPAKPDGLEVAHQRLVPHRQWVGMKVIKNDQAPFHRFDLRVAVGFGALRTALAAGLAHLAGSMTTVTSGCGVGTSRPRFTPSS